jgi:2-dehydropantoate 2-reductase
MYNQKSEPQEFKMHIAVFGTGGVGGYFGGRLAQAGENITFIARGEHLAALLANGLRVESIDGDFLLRSVRATDDPSRVTGVDVVLLCVKACQISQAARAILPMLGTETFVVPLQNGLDAPYQLAEILGREHVLGGVCGIFSHLASPGLIQHTGAKPWVAFGELDNHPSARSLQLLHVFKHAGIDTDIPTDINLAIWKKFLLVSALSGIGAVTRVPVGVFRSVEGTRQLLLDALHECNLVAQAGGIQLPIEYVAHILAAIDTFPPGEISSLQRDVMSGHPSELEAQIGAVVRMGKNLDIPTPVYSFIYHSLLPQEMLARGELVR